MLPHSLREFVGGSTITFVDVGARNDVVDLAGLAPWVDAWGFEPNPDEYQKLSTGETERFVITQVSAPRYRALRYLAVALGDRDGEAELFVTASPGNCSLLEPDMSVIAPYSYLRPMKKDFVRGFDVRAIVKVPVTTLEKAAVTLGIGYIDYLKLDTQGNEYDVLVGAGRLLRESRIGVIKCEVEFLPLYKRQKLFRDVDELLRSCGYGLVDLVGAGRVMMTRERARGERGLVLGGDAIYAVTDVDANASPEARQRAVVQGLVLTELGYVSLGAALIARHLGSDTEQVARRLRPPESPIRRGARQALAHVLPLFLYSRLQKAYWRKVNRRLNRVAPTRHG